MADIVLEFMSLDEPIEKIQGLLGDSFNVREKGNTWVITNVHGIERKWEKSPDDVIFLATDGDDGYMVEKQDKIFRSILALFGS